MKKRLLLITSCLLSISTVASGAIVYSGSQNVTLALNPMSPMDSRMIQLAGMGDDWADFRIELWLDMGMPGTMMMGMGTKLAIYAPLGMNMAMGGVLGLRDYASNLFMGSMIGPDSSFLDWAYLYGSGDFGERGGYVGLRTAMGNFAWLHMRRQSNMGTAMHSVTFDGWAYEDQPGVPIRAGVICNDGPILTTRPVCATKCPATETRCPATQTKCPETPTQCPPAVTQCPPCQTKCPTAETRCPAIQTKCPETQTRCPPVSTQCPPCLTKCPTTETRCPPTQTKCPPMLTRCPQTGFQCKFFGVLSDGPTVVAACPVVDTGAPWQITR
jgi:hypothetical protein